ncbi:formylglycine-generating enzyme family protein [Paraneptunicella aestuarii]|uniref:formylglycine-generating enzyme family protein n=1 Tax=Paraneptunicella aestuarii TaxID=2831148 RepID=UPI001E3CFB9D|nr:formylglycine-generating enzyme family protein [Paraneptunicella aestuarii]UAA39528.1 formylglycine-generating enzyme family protein [Paraneptunicella aestuarii]
MGRNREHWDLAEFDVRERWRSRPPKEFPSPWACEWGFDEYGLWQSFALQGQLEGNDNSGSNHASNSQDSNGKNTNIKNKTTPTIKYKMRFIPDGHFLMGSPEDEPERLENELQHSVTLTQGFWLGETTVTQALWQTVMGENPSRFEPDNADEQLPVEQVSWDDCVRFCEQLNQLVPGLNANLPTEAQWEYACRAGTQTPFSTGEKLTAAQANFYDSEKQKQKIDRFGGRTVSVDNYNPNPWGLKQMHGNVWEWCADDDQKKDALRVLRGGGWINFAQRCRSAYRNRFHRDGRNDYIGLRLSASCSPQ